MKEEANEQINSEEEVLVTQAIMAYEARSLKKRLANLELDTGSDSKKSEAKPQKTTIMWPRLMAAASLLVAAAASYFLLFPATETFDSLYSPLPNSYLPVTRGAGPSSALQDAFERYESEDFEQALVGFNQLPDSLVDDDVRLYHAIALMETEQYSEAKKLLREINVGESAYPDEVLWYTSLVQWKLGNNLEAERLMLSLIEQYPDFKRVAARKALKALKKEV